MIFGEVQAKLADGAGAFGTDISESAGDGACGGSSDEAATCRGEGFV